MHAEALGWLTLIGELDSELSMVLTWFIRLVRGRCGHCIAICPGAPQYKQSRLTQRRCFFASDKGPRRRATSISIGVGASNGIVLEVCIVGECGDATIEA
jgi:hypothetical protein